MAREGIQVEVEDGFARIEFLDRSLRGKSLAALLAVAGPGMIDVDTSGTRKTYIVPESIAAQAGLIEAEPEPAKPAKAPARRTRKPAADK